MKKTYNKSIKKFSFKNPLLIAVIVLVVAVGVFLIIRSFAATVVGAIEGESLVGSGSVISGDISAGGQASLKLTSSTPATGNVNITANGDRLEVRAKGDQCGGAPTLIVNIDGKDVMTANITGTTWGPYGQVFNIAPGTHSISARLSNPYTGFKGKRTSTKCTRALYIDSIQFQDTTTALAPAVDTTAPTVAISSPSNNTTGLSGTVNIDASASDNTAIAKVELYVDNAPYGSAITASPFKWSWDTTLTTNTSHTIYAKAYDTSGNAQSSTPITLSVDNTPVAGSTWGDHMGMNIWFTKANIDRVKTMGLKWVRISWETPWDTTYIQNSSGALEKLTDNVAYAHSKGIKVLQSCQKTPHSYTSADISSFASYCASWVDKGVDAIEIGNEWNHAPFWGVWPNGNYSLQAQISDATSTAIRAKSTTIPIMNSGWSPESQDLHPLDIPQQAMARLLVASTTFKNYGSIIANHPYAYNCDSPLKCSYPTRKDWNALLATADVYQAAKANGYDRSVWMTEIGGPSGGINPSSATGDCFRNAYTNQCFTVDSQRQLFVDYITGINQLRASGTPIEIIFWSSLVDGASATNSLEQTAGAYYSNWGIKPAGQVILDQVNKAW